VTDLAASFHTRTRVPDADLVRLTRAARAAGSSWAAIAAACGVRTSQDIEGVVSSSGGILPLTGAGYYSGPPSTRSKSSPAAAATRR
jgi:hypothetical protein